MTDPRDCARRPDPETLTGPLLHLFTRLALHPDASLAGTFQAQLVALASHPAVDVELRLVAGAIAIDPTEAWRHAGARGARRQEGVE